MAEEQPSAGHPAPATWGRVCHRVPNPGTGAAEKTAPPAPLTHSRTLTKPRGSRSMLKSILKPTIMGETKAASRNQGQHQPTAAASPAHPYKGTPCHTPSPGDGHEPTHRHSAGALQPQALSGGWGNGAVAVTRGSSTGHFVLWGSSDFFLFLSPHPAHFGQSNVLYLELDDVMAKRHSLCVCQNLTD